MRWVVASVLVLGCGRVAFEPVNAADADAPADTPPDTPSGMLGPELISNGDFSAMLSGWTTTVVSRGTFGAPYPAIQVWTASPLSGTTLLIDAPGDADGYAEQAVTAPAGGRLQLRLLTWGGVDAIMVKLSALDGTQEIVIDQYDPPCKEDRGCSTPDQRTYVIEGYAGTSVTLRVRASSMFGNRTRAFFDDVSLRQLL